MADYVQCPNCGGYKVSLQETITKVDVTIIKEENYQASRWRELSSGIGASMNVLFIGFWIPFIIYTIIFYTLSSNGFDVKSQSFGLVAGLAFIGYFLALIIFAFWKGFSKSKREREKELAREQNGEVIQTKREKKLTAGYKYYCAICGNQWTQMIGSPLPKVTVRPDLIKKVESQRWTCSYCGSSNDGTRTSCYVCTYPKPS